MSTKRIRRAAVRRCLVVAVIAVPLGSLAVANPSWAKSAGIDVWNVPELEAEIAIAERHRLTMDGVDAELVNRIAAKEVVIAELIAGRATLADATAQFLSMNADRPGLMNLMRAGEPDLSDEELTARNVLEFVSQRVPDPAERDAVLCRLAAEMAETIVHAEH